MTGLVKKTQMLVGDAARQTGKPIECRDQRTIATNI